MRTLLPSLALLLLAGSLRSQASLQDLVSVQGVRDNQLMGYGLVIGLRGTGDRSGLARQMAQAMLRKLGTNSPEGDIAPDNMAVAIVTATLPPFARPGARIDVTVSSIGDAQDLRGGQLLPTQLMGPDNRTMYAVATGPLAVGGLAVQGGSGSREVVNHPTVGGIPGGAIVERTVPMRFYDEHGRMNLLLRRPDYKTAQAIAEALNGVHPGSARALDGSTVEVTVPGRLKASPVTFLAGVGDLRIPVHNRARVQIDERNGTVVVGGDVVVLPVHIAQSNLSISVRESFSVSQPAPLSDGQTTVVPESDVAVSEEGTPLVPIPRSVNAGELAQALNSLGVSALDLVTIFRELHKQGALKAELVIR